MGNSQTNYKIRTLNGKPPPGAFNASDPAMIIAPFLFLGSSFASQNPKMLEQLGVTHVLNMAMELPIHYELINSQRIKVKHIPADDSLRYNIRFHFEEAFQMIDDARNTNGKVLVHCMMGISRSATIVIAYLMSRYSMSLAQAYQFTKSKRAEIQPNSTFMRILQDYEYELVYKSMMQTYSKNPAGNFRRGAYEVKVVPDFFNNI
jgi:protein-tyrosine phosphatase